MSAPTSWTHTAYAQQLVFGADAVDRLGEIVKSVGLRRVLVMTTEGRWASESGERVRSSLGRAATSVFDGVRSHVPADIVQAAVAQARADGADGIVSFGGGSCADAAKAVAFFAEQAEGTPGTSHVDRPVLPHVSVTTTYSGAELTPFFGMTDPSTRRKTGAGGPTSAPVL
ncbi:MAG TPA: iron-containing alcohol dehydrogenase, partial [Actinomycetota bacterium]|nr:iron-containing alcohol dehydrogenase [Actinomycetota bacterium]